MRVFTGTEAECDALQAIASKALGYPKIGTHVGGGIHVNMPPTWDGTGATPPGWTKFHAAVYVTSPADAAIQLEDDVAAACAASAALSVPEKSLMANAAATRRVNLTDPGIGTRTPKASASASLGTEAETETKP